MSLFEDTVTAVHVRPRAASARALAKSALALGLSFLVFLPVLPSMPSAGLDPSWRMALNAAWANGLNFAQGMVFTYGPYAFVSTGQYQPQTYGALLACSLFLGTVLLLLLRQVELQSKRAFPIFVILPLLIAAGYTRAGDVRFLCFAFLLLVAAARGRGNELRDVALSRFLGTPVVLSLASFSLGLICLVKATYAVEVGVMGVLSMIVLYARGRRLMAGALLLSFVSGLTAFWLIAGQPLADLPRFFFVQGQVAAAYSQAMSLGGNVLPPALFLLSALPLAVAIKRDLRPATVSKSVVAIGMVVTLFLAFKEGFVREDDWHVMTAAEALFIVPWCWQLDRIDSWRKVQAVMAGLTVIAFTVMYPHSLDLQAKVADAGNLLHCSDGGPIVCPTHEDWLEKTYDLSLARIRAQLPLPRLRGTMDVYTALQSLAIANGYRWDPRPVLQSYSAYTPALAQMNVRHLLGAKAPDGALFSLETIDWRLPTFADGPSWPILLSQYEVKWLAVPARPSAGIPIAYLEHKSGWRRISIVDTPLLETTVRLGQKVELPKSDGVLFAEIDIRPNTYGELENVLFHAPQLYINFLLPEARVESYRFIPGMARAGFVISPVVVNTSQFVAIRDLKVRPSLSARRPIAFWLSAPAGAVRMWTRDATVKIGMLREARN